MHPNDNFSSNPLARFLLTIAFRVTYTVLGPPAGSEVSAGRGRSRGGARRFPRASIRKSPLTDWNRRCPPPPANPFGDKREVLSAAHDGIFGAMCMGGSERHDARGLAWDVTVRRTKNVVESLKTRNTMRQLRSAPVWPATARRAPYGRRCNPGCRPDSPRRDSSSSRTGRDCAGRP